MLLPITSLFAGVFGIVYVLLSLVVINKRVEHKVVLGDNQNEQLNRVIRIHGNFAEYVPFYLILSALCELSQINREMIYLLGFIMLYGRVSHIYGVMFYEPKHAMPKSLVFRKTGMMATFASISISAILLLLQNVRL